MKGGRGCRMPPKGPPKVASTDSMLVEDVPTAFRRFLPHKGGLLVRMVESIEIDCRRSPKRRSLIASSGKAQILALHTSGFYLNDIDGTVVRVGVFSDISSIWSFQKYLRLTFASQEPLVLCLSPFEENTNSAPSVIVDLLQQYCKNVKIERAASVGEIVAGDASIAEDSQPSAAVSNATFAFFSQSSDSTSQVANADAALIRPLIVKLYERHNPHRLLSIGSIMNEFAGRERHLVHGIVHKYNISDEEIATLLLQVQSERGEKRSVTPTPPRSQSHPATITQESNSTEIRGEVFDSVPHNGGVDRPVAASPPLRMPEVVEVEVRAESPTRDTERSSDEVIQPFTHAERMVLHGEEAYPDAEDGHYKAVDFSFVEQRVAEASVEQLLEGDEATADEESTQREMAIDVYFPVAPDVKGLSPQLEMASSLAESLDSHPSIRRAPPPEVLPSQLESSSAYRPPRDEGIRYSPEELARLRARDVIHIPQMERRRYATNERPSFDDYDELPPAVRLLAEAEATSRENSKSKSPSTRMRSEDLTDPAEYEPFVAPPPLQSSPPQEEKRKAAFEDHRTYGKEKLTQPLKGRHGKDTVAPHWEELDEDIADAMTSRSGEDLPVVVHQRPLYDFFGNIVSQEEVVEAQRPLLANGHKDPNAFEFDEKIILPKEARDIGKHSFSSTQMTDTISAERSEPFVVHQKKAHPVHLGGKSLQASLHDDEKSFVEFGHSNGHASSLWESSLSPMEGLLGRYFVAANATDHRHILRPQNASSPHNGVQLTIEEIIRAATTDLWPLLRRGGEGPFRQVYENMSPQEQTFFFNALEIIVTDEWLLTSFLTSLAPVQGDRFESVTLTLAGEHGTPAQLQLPLLLLESFAAVWEGQKMFVMRVTSRHGAFDVNNVSLSFLEFLDRCNERTLAKDGIRLGTSGAAVRHVEAVHPQVLGKKLERLQRRAAMRADVSGDRTRTSSEMDFRRLWSLGNVLIRVESVKHNAMISASEDSEDFAHYGGSTIGLCSLPLAEWNDLVARWNAMHS